MTYSFDSLLLILSEKEEKLKRLEETWLQILSSTPMFTLLISFDFFSFFKRLSFLVSRSWCYSSDKKGQFQALQLSFVVPDLCSGFPDLHKLVNFTWPENLCVFCYFFFIFELPIIV